MPKGATRTTVGVHGFALREIRVRSGIETAALAAQLDVDRSYIAKIELGHSTRVSASFYASLLAALGITDRRTLMAYPVHEDAA